MFLNGRSMVRCVYLHFSGFWLPNPQVRLFWLIFCHAFQFQVILGKCLWLGYSHIWMLFIELFIRYLSTKLKLKSSPHACWNNLDQVVCLVFCDSLCKEFVCLLASHCLVEEVQDRNHWWPISVQYRIALPVSAQIPFPPPPPHHRLSKWLTVAVARPILTVIFLELQLSIPFFLVLLFYMILYVILFYV